MEVDHQARGSSVSRFGIVLLLTLFCPATGLAQQPLSAVVFRAGFVRDLLPTATFGTDVKLVHAATPRLYLTLEHERRQIDQKPFAGLPRVQLSPQVLRFQAMRGFVSNYVKLTGGVTASQLFDGWKPGYTAGAEVTLPTPAQRTSSSVYVIFRGLRERERVHVSPAAISAGTSS